MKLGSKLHMPGRSPSKKVLIFLKELNLLGFLFCVQLCSNLGHLVWLGTALEGTSFPFSYSQVSRISSSTSNLIKRTLT
jgi:hypothetical protein